MASPIFAMLTIVTGRAFPRRIKEEYGIPYVITEHSSAYGRGLLTSWQAKDARDALVEADGILVVSNSLKRVLQPYAIGKTIETVSNVVDTEFFHLPAHRSRTAAFRFLTVAHLVRHKGIDDLIQAFAELQDTQPSVTLEIGGDGPERQRLESLARELRLEGRITFLENWIDTV